MADGWRLIGDVGGTNVRFARVEPNGAITSPWSAPAANYPTFPDAIAAYLAAVDNPLPPATVAIAAAGPVIDDRIELTNNAWRIAAQDLRNRLGGTARVRLLNDLEAVAYALPYLPTEEIELAPKSPSPSKKRERLLAVNVGTGFGSSCLIAHGEDWVSCPSESGHMPTGAITAQDIALYRELGLDNPTHEDILSGRGVRALVHHFTSIDDAPHPSSPTSPEEDRPPDLAAPTPATDAACAVITRHLASACANLVLAHAAWDGVYLCGSVASAWWERADHRQFRSLFVGNSKMRERLAQTPVARIRTELPAFIGLANLPV